MKLNHLMLFSLLTVIVLGAASHWRFLQSTTLVANVPVPSPAFTLPDIDGQMHQQSEWKGKIVVVNLWATWCPPCVHEIPVFIETQKRYAHRDLQVIGIAMDKKADVDKFFKKMSINYPILLSTGKESLALAESFGNTMGVVPFTAIVNREGMIVRQFVGTVDRQTLETALIPLL